jgi:hypothetical protein
VDFDEAFIEELKSGEWRFRLRSLKGELMKEHAGKR